MRPPVLTRRSRRDLGIVLLLLAVLASLALFYLWIKRPLRLKDSVEPGGYSVLYSIYGAEGDRLHRPEEVAVDGDGTLYIADTFKHRVVVFDSDGKFIRSIGSKGTGYGHIEYPSGVATADGRLFVLSYTQNKIVVFDTVAKPIWEITIPEPESAVARHGRLYVATARGVMIGDLKGRLITSFGEQGNGPGQFDRPTGIAVDSKGDIYVSDSLNYRLQAFDKDGKFKWQAGGVRQGEPAGRQRDRAFGLPVGLAVDDKDRLYLVDAFAGEVRIFTSKGREIKALGEWGNDEGRFYFPAGIAYLGEERFAIADRFNDRVQVIRIPDPEGGAKAKALDWTVPLALLLVLVLIVVVTLRTLRKSTGA
ncbi:MAG: 6-bladed beta-propeller [Candidatus Aquicultorales bacterium]